MLARELLFTYCQLISTKDTRTKHLAHIIFNGNAPFGQHYTTTKITIDNSHSRCMSSILPFCLKRTKLCFCICDNSCRRTKSILNSSNHFQSFIAISSKLLNSILAFDDAALQCSRVSFNAELRLRSKDHYAKMLLRV